MPEAVDIKRGDLTAAEAQTAADAMFAYLRDVLYDPRNARLDVDALPEAFQDLGQGLLFVGTNITESRNLANDIAKGSLNSAKVSPENEFASGLKNLQATLKHITWQVGQVAKGDYQQRLRFAGEFSDSINDMICQLRERDEALREEIKLNQQMAENLQENVVFFEAMAANMTQWIIVVNTQTNELLYTNHQGKDVLLDVGNLATLRKFVGIQMGDEQIPGDVIDSDEGVVAPVILELTGGEDDLSQYFRGVKYPLNWHDAKAVVFVFTDITAEQRELEELENVAYFDSLTGTYSRHYGMQLLDKWLDAEEEFAIAFVDMDSLKFVNDTYGHNEGDAYIISVCNLLKDFDPKAKICRLGGDEFMLLCKGWSKTDADKRLEFLRSELDKQSGSQYTKSISYGVVEVDKNNDKSGSLLLSIADEIMYNYKRSRKMERRSET